MKTDLDELKKHLKDNAGEILQSEKCQCLFCRHSFDARKVIDWDNENHAMTALCPECGMDAVLGDASGFVFDKDELKEINLQLFGQDYMSTHPEAAETYIRRYRDGKITHNEKNEGTYVQYMSLLAGNPHYPDFALDLAEFFDDGGEFLPPDPQTAFSYYASPALLRSGLAYYRMGKLWESGRLGKKDERGALLCYTKGMAMRSFECLIAYADCINAGIEVEPDPEFAFSVIDEAFLGTYGRYVYTVGNEALFGFPMLCYRLACSWAIDRPGAPKNETLALRYFLMAASTFDYADRVSPLSPQQKSERDMTRSAINKLARKFHLRKQNPVLDEATFEDTLEELEDGYYVPEEGYHLSNVEYDEENKTLSFDLTGPDGAPQFVVDCGNLFAGFLPGTLRWEFDDVIDAQFLEDAQIDEIDGDSTVGFTFFRSTKEGREVVFEVKFSHPNDKNENEAVRRKKGDA